MYHSHKKRLRRKVETLLEEYYTVVQVEQERKRKNSFTIAL